MPQILGRARSQPASTLLASLVRWGFVLLMVGAIFAAHRVAPVTVTLVIDGGQERIVTRAGTVADLLLAHHVSVGEGDLVRPGPASRLHGGDRVEVHRARAVRLRADGRALRHRTQARTPRAILHEVGVSFAGDDLILVDGAPSTADRPLPERGGARAQAAAGPRSSLWLDDVPRREAPAPHARPPGSGPSMDETLITIDVLRAVPVMLVEEGVPLMMAMSGTTVRQALQGAGIHLWPEDGLQPPRETPLSRAGRIQIRRALPFIVEADEQRREVRALASSVGDALDAVGLPLRGRDYAVPPVDAALTRGMTVQVVRVVEDILVRQVAIPYGTRTEPDESLELDEQRVLRPGVPGQKTQRIKITYEDGDEVGRELMEETMDREPEPELVAYGTRIVWRTVDTPEGPKRSWRRLRMLATSYSASRAGTPSWVPWYGRTRLGWQMRTGIVAVDPRTVPLRTNVFVPGYGVGVAGDTGGGIKGYRIDLGYSDDEYRRWRQWVDVYLLEPLPPHDQIRWILP